MADVYASYAALAREMVNGQDFQVEAIERPSSGFLIIAPHGGNIEKGTSEVARAISGEDLSFYAFEGLRRSGNRDLHITSHRFDEPTALQLAGRSRKVIGVHGRRNGGDSRTAYLGGLDEQLVAAIKTELSASGFPARSGDHDFPAKHLRNICNRGTSGSGAQLELPLDFRVKLLENEELMNTFAGAVRAALLRSTRGRITSRYT